MDVRTAAIEILSKSQDSVSDDVINHYMSKLSSIEERADLKNIIQSVLEKGKYAGRDYKSPTDIANNAKRKANNIEGGSQTGISAMPHVKEYGGSGASAASNTAKKMKQLSSKNHVHIKNGEGTVVDVVHASGRKKGKTVFKDDAEKKAHLAELNKSLLDKTEDILRKAKSLMDSLKEHHAAGTKTGVRLLDTHLADARGEKRMATGEEMASLKKPKKTGSRMASRSERPPREGGLPDKQVAARMKGAKTLGQLSGVGGTRGEQKAASEDNVQSMSGYKKKKEKQAKLNEHKANQAEHKDISSQIDWAMRVGMDEHGNLPQPSKPKLSLVKYSNNGQWSLNKISEKMNVVEGKDDKNDNPHGASEKVNAIGGKEDQIN